MLPENVLVGKRYQVQETIGSGGMGAVYRALDRLTGQQIALKQLVVPLEYLELMSRTWGENLRLSLMREFQLLASLRHPYIISVLDYGFENQLPFMTMELVEGAEMITKIGVNHPPEVQVRLLVQLLEALAYLHRRGIIHRDLKPGNVLYANETIKVLDFGLSLVQGERGMVEGTLAYLAPEFLKDMAAEDVPASISADLYAVGVIAYEMFTGKLPFYSRSPDDLVETILNTPPDMTPMASFPPGLVAVITKLLAKTPDTRYKSAEEVIEALTPFTSAVSSEKTVIRESYLQAAQFVGREAEFNQLLNALRDIEADYPPKGSLWLVGGESGVGKSRLLDELRVYALVKGFLVLRGQGVAEGGLPFQLWRDVARRLVISTELSDLEAGILQELVTDISSLRDRPVTPAAAIEGAQRHQRLSLTIIDMLRRQTQPILIILEDMHWVSESLEILKAVITVLPDLSVLIVGSYRDDERPNLPEQLPGANLLFLKRLSPQAVAELSTAMLGTASSAVIQLVQRETEGNAFFIVEVVRALAETAGRLTDIGRITLPQQVFAGGIQSVIQRRLDRLPQQTRELLKVAAVAGRQLDLSLLRTLRPGMFTDTWLADCGNVAVLEVKEEVWRFSHDKLRETLLSTLSQEERPVLYREVAEAIETLHPNDDAWAATLVDFWYVAVDPEKEARYARINADQSYQVGAYDVALRSAKRALEIICEYPERELEQAELLNQLGLIYHTLGNFSEASAYFERGLALAQKLNNPSVGATAYQGWGSLISDQGNQARAKEYLEKSLELGQGNPKSITRTLRILGVVEWELGNIEKAGTYFEQSLAAARETGDVLAISGALNNLGVVKRALKDLPAEMAYYEESLTLKKSIGDRRGLGLTLNNLGLIARYNNDLDKALDYYGQSLALQRAIGVKLEISLVLGNIAVVHLLRDELETAENHLCEALRMVDEMGAVPRMLATIGVYVSLYHHKGALESAAELLGLLLNHPATLAETLNTTRDDYVVKLQDALAPEVYSAAVERGSKMNLGQLVAELTKNCG